jgi:RNA polymerase sigma-70 factor (ECF subfamily)
MDRAAISKPIANADTGAAVSDDFDSVVRHYRPKVFRFALASLRDRDAAGDVTQDCFLKAHRAWDSFRHDCSMETWLMQIAVNLVRDRARNRRLQFWKRTQMFAKPVETISRWFAGSERTPEARALLKEQVEAVWDAAAELPERQRTVFLLRFVEDMDILDIAATTGLKEGTVKAHLFRALQSVRERMGARR